jgi:precorrin-6B methylase 1
MMIYFPIDENYRTNIHVRNPDMKKHWLDEDHEIVGLSNANMTPWNVTEILKRMSLNKIYTRSEENA